MNSVSETQTQAVVSTQKYILLLAGFAFALFIFLFSGDAYASAGGLTKLESEANSWKTAAYSFIGVCAIIYLLWEGGKLWGNKIDWMDFGVCCLKVAVVGGVPALGVYFWGVWA